MKMVKLFVSLMGLFLLATAFCRGEDGAKKPIFFMKLADLTPDSALLADYPETVRKGIEFLKTADLMNIPLGETKIDGDDVFANVMEYETHAGENVISESHRRYIDIQYIIVGQEMMACVPYSEDLPVSEPYHEDEDYALYPAGVMPFWADGSDYPAKVLARAGELAIFSPNDVHASGVYPEKPEKIRKVVVKCRVAE